jgi:hypothetical protein
MIIPMSIPRTIQMPIPIQFCMTLRSLKATRAGRRAARI